MQNNSSVFNLPFFTKGEAYDFDAAKEDLIIYEELNAIAEEIELCRLRNS